MMNLLLFALGAIAVTISLCLCAALIVGTWTGLVKHVRGQR